MKIRTLLLAMLSVIMMAFATVPTAAPAAAIPCHRSSDGFCRWQHVGHARAFPNRIAAMAARAAVFASWGYSPKVIERALQVTSQKGGLVMFINGIHLNHMSTAGGFWTNVITDFDESTDGIQKSVGGLFIWAEWWQFEVDGVIYNIYLPAPCDNWADRLEEVETPPPIAQQPECAYLNFMLVKGHEVHGMRVDEGERLTPDVCGPAFRAPGSSEFVAIGDECHRVQCDFIDATNWLRRQGYDVHQDASSAFSFIAAETGMYTLRLPIEAVTLKKGHRHWHILCDLTPQGRQSQAVYIAPWSYHMDEAYVAFMRQDTAMLFGGNPNPPDVFTVPDPIWHGVIHTWDFTPWVK